MIIDFHTHIVSPVLRDKREEFLKRDPCFCLLYSHPKAKLATAADIIASMDEHAVAVSVVLNLGWTSHDLCVMTNDYILESIAHYPKRLVGFCAVQPRAGDKALREIERCASNGALGIGEIRPDIQGFALSDTTIMKPVAEMLTKHNLLLLMHASEPVGHTYSGKGAVTPDMIYPFIINSPDLRIVCAHWGGGLPFYALMPEVSAAFKNVYVDTAATPFLYKPAIFKHVAEIVGSNHILFGTDYPLMSPKRVLDQMASSGLSSKEMNRILGGNAQKLLSL